MPSLVSVYPDATEVFTDHELMQRLMAPIAVVTAEDGTELPLVLPFEPMAGRLGERTRDVHTAFASPDRIGFRLTPDARLDFLGDPRFFELVHRAEVGSQSRMLTAFYEDQYAAFAHARRRGVLAAQCLEFFDPDLACLDPRSEAMPNGDAFVRVLTLDPSHICPRSSGCLTLWWEPLSSTVLLTRED